MNAPADRAEGPERAPAQPSFPAVPADLPFRPVVAAAVGISALVHHSTRLGPSVEAPPLAPPLLAPPSEVVSPPGSLLGVTERPPPSDDVPTPPKLWAPPPALMEPQGETLALPDVPWTRQTQPRQETPLLQDTPWFPAPSVSRDGPVFRDVPVLRQPPSPLAPLSPVEPPSPVEDPAPGAAEPPPAATAERPLPLADYPAERVARIEARLARRPAEEASILEEEGLSAAFWPRLLEHWAEVLGDESRRGRSAQNRAYDAAYVAQIEAERGPIGPSEYGQIVVAIERGEVEAVLSELGIPKDASILIQRVWLQRILADPEAAKAARVAVLAARVAA